MLLASSGGEVVLLVILIIVAIIVLSTAYRSVKLIQQGFVGVQKRLGQYHSVRNPGVALLVPFVDQVQTVDVREIPRTGDQQDVITKDNVSVLVSATIFSQVVDPKAALFSVANIGVWGGTGFNMIVIYTALRAAPAELYEAARIDGASQVQVALRVKIPMIAPALVLTGVFSIRSCMTAAAIR